MELDKQLDTIGNYTFQNKELFLTALTHTSYANEGTRKKSNQRLEFLGDSVLGIVIGKYVFEHFKDKPEGELTKIRAGIVCEKALAKCAQKLHIGDMLLLGKGEEITGGRTRASNTSDAFEAVVGAVFLDSDFYRTEQFVLDALDEIIQENIEHDGIEDYKTALQETSQKNFSKNVEYRLLGEEGPDHMKNYRMAVLINGKQLGEGCGCSKKEAEQNAAKNALEVLGQSGKSRK